MWFRGDASGHDFLFHLASWMDVSRQWHEGVLYPRWADWANWGFGEPRFVFYPPASWMLGAALGSVLPWRMVPGAFIWLTLVTAGMSMWKLAREWLPAPQAAAAAVLFAVNPYHLVIVYYRSDFSELLAVALLPLLVLGALNTASDGWRSVPLLAAVFAAIWLANAPAAVIATYSLGLVPLIVCVLRRSLRPLFPGATAMVGGFGLAAFYILPAAWERRWVQIQTVVAEDFQPVRNFLFTRANEPAFTLFNWKVSTAALGMILVAVIAALIAAKKRREFGELWWTLVILGAASVFLMLPPSRILWRHLPELHFLQFPWRWLDVLGLVFACMIALAMSSARKQIAWLTALLLLTLIGEAAALMVQDAWWDSQGAVYLSSWMSARPGYIARIERKRREQALHLSGWINSGRGYEGTDEYQPLGCDRSELPGNPDDETRPARVSSIPAPLVEKLEPFSDPDDPKVVPATGVRLHFYEWSAGRKDFTAQTPGPVTLALRLLVYPAWIATVDGKSAGYYPHPVTGQMLLPLAPGAHRVELRFVRTWDRTAGGIISAFTAAALLVFAGIFRGRAGATAAAGA